MKEDGRERITRIKVVEYLERGGNNVLRRIKAVLTRSAIRPARSAIGRAHSPMALMTGPSTNTTIICDTRIF